jgi:hypothetical protein
MGWAVVIFFGDSRLLSPFPGVTYTLDVWRTGQRPPAFDIREEQREEGLSASVPIIRVDEFRQGGRTRDLWNLFRAGKQ